MFDRRGSGASDPLPLDSLPPWESYAQGLTAVLDEVGSQQAALLAQLDASPMALFFAGTPPTAPGADPGQRHGQVPRAADDYPIGAPAEVAEAFLAQLDQSWGTEAMAAMSAPTRADDQRFCRWLARFQRTIASPRAVQAFLGASFEMDARPILPLIQAPTLVLHRRNFPHPDLPRAVSSRAHPRRQTGGAGPGPSRSLFWETPEPVLDHIEQFLTGVRRVAQPTRRLATVLFTDIVGSTERAGGAGRPALARAVERA